EEDIAAYTVRAVDDPRTLDKILYMRLLANMVSHNELIAMWERKTGRTFQIERVPEADLLKLINGRRVHASSCTSRAHIWWSCVHGATAAPLTSLDMYSCMQKRRSL
uniref:Mediator complex subunit 17 n=1 Tax=Aegilops tauschii subsp. strangulata TaxID=200361 RepID=A0A453QLE8_AEGTS